MLNLTHCEASDTDEFLARCIEEAQGRIAPTWPLDQFIAVNPYWGWRGMSFLEAQKKLWKLAGAPLTMSRTYLLNEHEDDVHSQADNEGVISSAGESVSRTPLLVTELIDQQRDASEAQCWQQFVKHQISQHCAAYFDEGQASWHLDQNVNLFASWRTHTAFEQGPLLQLDFERFKSSIEKLPHSAFDLIRTVLPAMGIDKACWTDYLTALLLDINGWAAWCAYDEWQAKLVGKKSMQIVELMAIRLAWEWVLYQRSTSVGKAFGQAWQSVDNGEARWDSYFGVNQRLLQRMERTYQASLVKALTQTKSVLVEKPDFQAVFCIDVRSEVYRRALEESHPAIETRGFAGFFGLPIAYRERGTANATPQLPGLLAPKYWVSESDSGRGTRQALLNKKRWQDMRQNASSGFTFVETLGLFYGVKLVKNALFGQPSLSSKRSEAELMLYSDSSLQSPVDLDEQCALAKQILTAMGLRESFSRLILLCGHGTECTNNPHAAGLDCGACGGQAGAINVRLLVGMLNNPAVRAQLKKEQMVIPDESWFIAGLHNTTTDEIHLFNLDQVPAARRSDLASLQSALVKATHKSRHERAPLLGMTSAESVDVTNEFEQRASDWAQIRPEWGLANNAAFIVAPRSRSRALNLKGRVFLHDYEWQNDAGFGLLELIMTAPMIVTNWINMQYYASTVDNPRFGSGSKILHNVVGLRLGVFEGNGGDLRIGLPWQSLHNGEKLMHTPLRLSVFIAAPRKEIDVIIAKHSVLRDLIDNQWLHLLQIDDDENQIYCRQSGQWQLFQAD